EDDVRLAGELAARALRLRRQRQFVCAGATLSHLSGLPPHSDAPKEPSQKKVLDVELFVYLPTCPLFEPDVTRQLPPTLGGAWVVLYLSFEDASASPVISANAPAAVRTRARASIGLLLSERFMGSPPCCRRITQRACRQANRPQSARTR